MLSADKGAAETSDDNKKVRDILSNIVSQDLRLLNIRRKGKKALNKKRLIITTLPSEDTVLTVLKNKRKYKGPTKISQDLTSCQRNHLNNLRDRLRKR